MKFYSWKNYTRFSSTTKPRNKLQTRLLDNWPKRVRLVNYQSDPKCNSSSLLSEAWSKHNLLKIVLITTNQRSKEIEFGGKRCTHFVAGTFDGKS